MQERRQLKKQKKKLKFKNNKMISMNLISQQQLMEKEELKIY